MDNLSKCPYSPALKPLLPRKIPGCAPEKLTLHKSSHGPNPLSMLMQY